MPKAPRFGKQSKKRKDQISDARENIPPEGCTPPDVTPDEAMPKASLMRRAAHVAEQVLSHTKNRLNNVQRRARHLRTRNATLNSNIAAIKLQEKETKKKLEVCERQKGLGEQANLRVRDELIEVTKAREELSRMLMETRTKSRAKIEALKKRLRRAADVRDRAVKRVASRTSSPAAFNAMQKRMYSVTSRKLLRMLVSSGCARSKAGRVLSILAAQFGVKTKVASRRTVSRAVLEGYIAAKMQLGYEINKTPALTANTDSTSHLGVNIESRHITMRVPDYKSDDLAVDPKSKPKIRLLCVDSTLDHTADTAVKDFLGRVEEALDFFNRSPLAAILKIKLTIRTFLRLLKGMNGDHASKEKSAARGMGEKKHNAAIDDLGEDALLSMTVGNLVKYLGAWNQKKIADAGGIEEWNKLSPMEQATRDKKLMEEIIIKLGKDEYDALSPEDRRILDLFIWAGCCMHKDQNSFQAGNTEMVLEWIKLGIVPPILLANKANAATLRNILDPGKHHPTAPLSEDEQRAFEQTTRGGVKTTALAGSILNNTNSKKGQGDRHPNYFKEKVDKLYTHFPDTSNTRFGSHGDAAADLIQYLDAHIDYINLIRLSKQTPSLTNLEHNVLQALQDPATITELCTMVLYTQAVSKPYMRAVRGPKSDNVLDLGPLHVAVHEFVRGIIKNPDILVSEDVSHVNATLDGRNWDNPHAVEAVIKLMPTLPHLKSITVAFFHGALVTWERFSSEFAPGGLIDEASAEERHLAWMPATNDVNEGALGSYRVIMRNRPNMTLHQYNALAMFRHNDTQDFMDATFTFHDHTYVMQEARHLDASGMEATRRKDLVDYRIEVAQMKKDKEEARQAKLKADAERLAQVVLITQVSDIYNPKMKFTIPKLGEQMDAFRFRGLPDVPAKSKFPKKADRQAALEKVFIDWLAFIAKNGVPAPPHTLNNLQTGSHVTISDDWEAAEEAEMEE